MVLTYNLSYLITTRNRLPFLKITLEKLINELQPDEEIIVVDGNSADGSKEYLQQLFDGGKIRQFISEPDKNQAHAWNKAMLMAKGALIKKIIDDDVYDYAAIRGCKEFMLTNAWIDICISNNLEGSLTEPARIGITGRLPQYRQWKDGIIKSFTFSDVSMLIRKSSLSFLGLYDTQFKMMDWEYALRVSYLQASIAYFTGYNALSVGTPGNITSTATKQLLKLEGRIGKIKYNYAGDGSETSFYSQIKVEFGKLYSKRAGKKKIAAALAIIPADSQLKQVYALYYKKLEDHNKTGEFNFLY